LGGGGGLGVFAGGGLLVPGVGGAGWRGGVGVGGGGGRAWWG
jgi:hypothetical protein